MSSLTWKRQPELFKFIQGGSAYVRIYISPENVLVLEAQNCISSDFWGIFNEIILGEGAYLTKYSGAKWR